MPESNLTKKVLAQTFKELVREQSFEKVSVSDICDTCQVSRKTFYYHFRDKYALVEWIFETEFIAAMKETNFEDRWSFVRLLCGYFYQERLFYAKLMQFHGQNSFRQYFQEFLQGVLEPFILPASGEIVAVAQQDGIDPETARLFYAHFITDAVLMAIFRWVIRGANPPPEDFVTLLKSATDLLSIQVTQWDDGTKANRNQL